MNERILHDYNDFVLPFLIGFVFLVSYLFIGLVRLIYHIPPKDRRKLLMSFINPRIFLKNIKDITFDCLLHIKIYKRNLLLGYMHFSIAFGWFMLIVVGHIEVLLYAPKSTGWQHLYYPIFFRYFLEQNGQTTLRGAFFFFLMDFFLLMVLGGIGLAIFKRIKSLAFGMRRTTQASFADTVVLYCLWAIFPLRLLAEGFTAGISGGSFLTKPVHYMFANFFGNDLNIMPTWWAYSISLGLFFLALPFSRYMHIPTEPLLIVLRNAGLKARKPRKGFSEAEIYSCPSCGLCIDACPMNVQIKNLKLSSVYYMRFLRRHNHEKTERIAGACLMCGKCVAICPVGIDSCGIKIVQRGTMNNSIQFDYNYLQDGKINLLSLLEENNNNEISSPLEEEIVPKTNIANKNSSPTNKEKVIFFAGCMTHITPIIIKSMKKIFVKAGIDYIFADANGGICCGRPLLLAGKHNAANEIIKANTKIFKESGANTLVVSCPICYKVFNEEYKLKGIKVIHHTEYINNLINENRLQISKNDDVLVYHDPCDLGRGSNIYEEPRNVLRKIGNLKKAEKEGKESICCGGSLGSLTLNRQDRVRITQSSLQALTYAKPDKIITACPLCKKTFAEQSGNIPVMDIAEIVANNLI